MNDSKRLLFIVNDARMFLCHRGMLADAARSRGFEIHVAAPRSSAAERVTARGFAFHELAIDRGGRNPLGELATLFRFIRLIVSVRPTLLHLINIKPVLYGGLAARLLNVPACVFAVSGLGYVFLARGFRARLLRALVLLAYRVVFAHPRSAVIFQNRDDLDFFVETGAVTPERTALIAGSGVELDVFRPSPEPGGIPTVVLPARLLRDKGVVEFVEAAQLLRGRGAEARFVLVGPVDPANPSAVSEAELRAWVDEGIVEWWGLRDDMPAVLSAAHVVCLPSYREGIPRALIEAAACGRPIVTTDVPGCRDVVRHGLNGLLVPVRSPAELAAALERVIGDLELRRALGSAGRRIAETELSPTVVLGQALTLYDALTPAPVTAGAASLPSA